LDRDNSKDIISYF